MTVRQAGRAGPSGAGGSSIGGGGGTGGGGISSSGRYYKRGRRRSARVADGDVDIGDGIDHLRTPVRGVFAACTMLRFDCHQLGDLTGNGWGVVWLEGVEYREELIRAILL